eukprot:CAMPEP_0177485884 /NCGR_PEP_ID=MMETSP0369-20130122/28795_1 /TAXON_ID=447022 ORGANISM="Scrippsiella hangoei-like, Strain SHHI-4" /NCGR_SAMPLE_ID=MMETSP0369 /ASSEMBLY_ACC=CAM_ASM_000364 /LENGTH=113 /DNA_ID=CAMNT_0018962085 /DNA_START=54 /DNA_END=391 /DNA_ORIENTATION=+
MAKTAAATAVLLAVPASAFAPQGSMRSRPSEPSLRAAEGQTSVGCTADVSTGQVAVGICGFSVACIAASASRASRRQPAVARRNQFFDNGGITATGVCAPFPELENGRLAMFA